MQENWSKIEEIYGEHDIHLTPFIEVSNEEKCFEYEINLNHFRMYQVVLLLKNVPKKFE